MNKIIITLAALSLSGCAVVTSPEAERVHLHTQASTILILDSCKKLGLVKGWGESIESSYAAIEQAKTSLRQAAYDRYNADSVLLVNMDIRERLFKEEVYMNGIAYNCFK